MKVVCALILLLSQIASAGNLGPVEAIRRAEFFIGQNGYANWPDAKIKRNLDMEPLENPGHYRDILRHRFNTLQPKAIGIRAGRPNTSAGWSVGFDYVNSRRGPDACRVVTMNPDGSNMHLEPVVGQRNFFAGVAPPRK